MKTMSQRIRTGSGRTVLATSAWSDDRVYRYGLGQVWDDLTPAAAFVLLNPDPEGHLSPTVQSALRIARQLGCGGILLVSLHAVVGTPDELLTLADPVGPGNFDFIARTLERTNPAFTIAAWGTHPAALKVSALLVATAGRDLTCLGRNRDGSPWTPTQVTARPALEQYP